jgi:hypothetical protein
MRRIVPPHRHHPPHNRGASFRGHCYSNSTADEAVGPAAGARSRSG